MAQAVSRRHLIVEDWEIRFLGWEDRQTEGTHFKMGSKPAEGLKRFWFFL
jgi:hypothetical protein